MSTVEGGMVVTNDTELYKLLLLKRSHGLARELPVSMHAEIRQQYPEHDFTFLFLTDGFNVRNTELAAVMGQRQLTRMNGYIAIRNRNYDRFLEIIARYPEHLLAVDRPGRSNFCFPFVCRSKSLRAQLQSHLQASGIETRMLISGNLLRQPFLRQFDDAPAMPNADLLHENAFYIGNNQFVDDARLDRLANLLSEVLSLPNDTSGPDWHRAAAGTVKSIA
jgi:CDP-4-dehydro-6-deoxyglucose reductase, E1